MFFATWEFLNPFLKKDALFTTGYLHFPAHTPLQRSVQVPPPSWFPFNLLASYKTVMFEHPGDHWIFLPPGTGFLLIRFAMFLIQVCSNVASVVNAQDLVTASLRLVSMCRGGWDWSGRTCSSVTTPLERFQIHCLGSIPSPDKTRLVFSNYCWNEPICELVRWTVRKI